MKNRLIQKLEEAKKNKRKLLCVFITLGFPNLKTTEKLIEGFQTKGVDLIELGFPFSDPLADGPTIQFSSEAALKRGVKMRDAFRMVKNLRRKGINIPILFFSYLNPIFQFGIKRFPSNLKEAGFDGLIIPDCPPEEDEPLWSSCRKADIAPVFLVAPTTTRKRARKIFAGSRGFLYYVSLRGVTGARKSLPRDLSHNLKALHRIDRKPILIGFGVSTPSQAKTLSKWASGVIVGSAIVARIRDSKGKEKPVLSFVESLARSLHH